MSPEDYLAGSLAPGHSFTVKFVERADSHPGQTGADSFRVVVWKPGDSHDGQLEWGEVVYDIESDDVREVIAWAETATGESEVYELFARLPGGHHVENDLLVHLAGESPNPESSPPGERLWYLTRRQSD
jgi:hypothetical protein